MLRILLVSVLLSLDPAWGIPNGTEPKVLREYICDDEPIIQMQRHLEILSVGMENLRLRMENMNMVLSDISRKRLGPKKIPTCVHPTSCRGLAGGLQVIQLNSSSPFIVPCDNTTQGGGWAVIQRRLEGSTNFNRNWTAYKRGFGDLEGEFFIGLDKLHKLTSSYANELLLVTRDEENIERFAKYDAFAVGDEDEYYPLSTLGNYSGDARDPLRPYQSHRFYVHQKLYKVNGSILNSVFGWWETDSLGPRYYTRQLNVKYDDGYSLTYLKMMVRPKTT